MSNNDLREAERKGSEVVANRLVVRNISFDMPRSAIFALANKYGKTTEIEVPCDSFHEHKGFAFFEYEKTEDAQLALEEIHDREFHGRPIFVRNFYKDRPTESRSRTKGKQKESEPQPEVDVRASLPPRLSRLHAWTNVPNESAIPVFSEPVDWTQEESGLRAEENSNEQSDMLFRVIQCNLKSLEFLARYGISSDDWIKHCLRVACHDLDNKRSNATRVS